MQTLYTFLLISLFSFNSFSQWRIITPLEMRKSSCITIAGNYIFVGTSDNGIYQSINNGDTWTSVNNGLPLNIIISLDNNGSRIFGSTYYDIITSTDNGANWSTHYNGLGAGFPANSFLVEGNTVYAAGYGVYITNDEGFNWTRITAGLPSGPVVYSIIRKDGILYAGTHSGVYYSNDNGLNWNQSGTGINSFNILALISSGNNIIAGTDSAGPYLSADNGNTWNKITNGLPQVNRTRVSRLIKISGHIVAGLGYNPNGSWGAYHSSDDGVTWDNIGQGIEPLTGVTGMAANNNYGFITSNFGVYRRPATDITNIEDENELIISKDFILHQNYPNPFNPTTKISWQSSVSGNQTIKIYDVLGNEISTLIDEYKPAGNYEIDFDGSKLSSGNYFYRLTSGSYSETKSFVVLK